MKRLISIFIVISLNAFSFSQNLSLPEDSKLVFYLDWDYVLNNYKNIVDEIIQNEIMFDKDFPKRININPDQDINKILFCYPSEKDINITDKAMLEKDMTEKSFIYLRIKKTNFSHSYRNSKYKGYTVFTDNKISLNYLEYKNGLVFSYNPVSLQKFIDLNLSASNKMIFNLEREEYLYVEGIFYSDYLKLIKNIDQNTLNLVRREIDKIDKYSLKVFNDENILITLYFENAEDSANVMNILNGLIAF